MAFVTESEFEQALIYELSQKGWESEVLKYKTEEDLIKNWADILFQNNRGVDRLNDCPLTDSEMQQIIEQIIALKTPLKLNGFINGKTVSITRDNPDDKLHLGKEVGLKIYDRHEIAAGQSRYQIAQQPQFKGKSKILNDRRGDLILLINGMPVIHIELKRSGIDVSQASYQIEKYSYEKIFTGLFSLVQVFVAMNPEDTLYFANPGADGLFNKDFYFRWADFNNEPINNWKDIASSLLSIPMAHQIIGFYTVADDKDGILKVLRSYQYYAANAISDKVAKTKWDASDKLGGFIWHTTGSGKTMTSFKSAQLIANSKDADKVIFLMDRIELGAQSLEEYKGFADDNEEVQATENTGVLISKLKSKNPSDTLIVTSIQKMSNIKDEEGGLNSHDIGIMNSKRIVFIVDECHRSTFGDMLIDIKKTFDTAIFFGFTGTPIQEENQRKLNTTATVFGDKLHRYSIADGIRDKNVLGFDPYKMLTYQDNDIRREVALMKSKAKTESEAISDPKKSVIYYKYMDSSQVKMYSYIDSQGKFIKGIEDYLPNSQYEHNEKHQKTIVNSVLKNWLRLSKNSKFHAIFATSSIPEAIEYYRLFKNANPDFKVIALFDPNIDNVEGAIYKEEGLVEIIDDYNKRYQQKFTLSDFQKMKKDIALRLAHKKPYLGIHNEPKKQIDLLIVVNQMLTGFDSKWINTLYLDKTLEYANLIQAFSRTNRLFGNDKPFGNIFYYRKPHTMEENIKKAVNLYSGNKPLGLFAQNLDKNLNKMNFIFNDIKELFNNAGILNFEKLPNENTERGKFASLFKIFNLHLESAKIQGFAWDILIYKEFSPAVTMEFDENTYNTLLSRYKELFCDGGGRTEDVPFEIDTYLTEIDTGKIDSDYMNSRFKKYLKSLEQQNLTSEQLKNVLNELYKSFAVLSQDDQKYANIFLHDVQCGNIIIESEKTFNDYINQYKFNAKNAQINKIVECIGVDKKKLKAIMESRVTEINLNEYGRFDNLKTTVDKTKAREYLEKIENVKMTPFETNMKIDELLKEFILKDGFEIKN